MWNEMQEEIQSLAIRNIYRVGVRQREHLLATNIQESRPTIITSGGGSTAPSKPEPIRATTIDKLGRNDPCWCGSGKKYKHCHYRQDMENKQLTSARH